MLKNKILLILIILLSIINTPSVFARREHAPQKACFSNQRVILGAIEMYNMDHSEMLTECNENILNILHDEGYLKQMPSKPTDKCEYLSSSDLTSKGVIYCKYHGSVEYDEKEGIGVSPSREYLDDQARIEFNRKMNTLLPFLISFGVVVVIVYSIIPTNKKKVS
jgi:competence protein ComGC